jgi:CRISPR/Cas system CSM-associated protein Csm3 (group 7 of RAMP superfamily)
MTETGTMTGTEESVAVLGFVIRFHSGFRVGGSYADDGIDAAGTDFDPLPADSLKGVMRAAAANLLGEKHPLVGEVFGDTRTPSAWSWTAAQPIGEGTWTPSLRHRVAIDSQEFAALKEHLVLAEQMWVPQARFTIERIRHLTLVQARRSVALLRVSAGTVHGLGAWRRRGLGWVEISPESGPVTAEDVAQVLAVTTPAPVVGGEAE